MTVFALLPEQGGLFHYRHLLGPGVAHNLATELEIPLGVEPRRVHAAVARLLERQSALRCAVVGNPPAAQRLGPVAPELVESEVPDVSSAIGHRLNELYHKEFSELNDPKRAHFELFRDQRSQTLLVLADHLVTDHHSLGLIAGEAAEALGLPGRHHPPRDVVDYVDLCRARDREQSARAGRETRIWAQALEGVAPLRGLMPHGHDGKLVRAQRDSTHNGPELATVVRRLADHLNISVFSVVALLVSLAIWRRGEQRSFVVQTPVSTRRDDRSAGTVGYLINERPLVCRIDPTRTLRAHGHEIWKSCVRAFRHSHLGVPQLVDAVPAYRDTLDGRGIDYVQLHVTDGDGRLPGAARPRGTGTNDVVHDDRELGAFRPGAGLTCTTLRFDFSSDQTLVRTFFGGPEHGLAAATALTDDVVSLARKALRYVDSPVAGLDAATPRCRLAAVMEGSR